MIKKPGSVIVKKHQIVIAGFEFEAPYLDSKDLQVPDIEAPQIEALEWALDEIQERLNRIMAPRA